MNLSIENVMSCFEVFCDALWIEKRSLSLAGFGILLGGFGSVDDLEPQIHLYCPTPLGPLCTLYVLSTEIPDPSRSGIQSSLLSVLVFLFLPMGIARLTTSSCSAVEAVAWLRCVMTMLSLRS